MQDGEAVEGAGVGTMVDGVRVVGEPVGLRVGVLEGGMVTVKVGDVDTNIVGTGVGDIEMP